MSIPNSLLALLASGPAHGYGLKSAFEESTANAWPLNAGQVYTTLARLERDGMVEADGDSPERRSWQITAEGRAALDWIADFIASERIDCAFRRSGRFGGSRSRRGRGILHQLFYVQIL